MAASGANLGLMIFWRLKVSLVKSQAKPDFYPERSEGSTLIPKPDFYPERSEGSILSPQFCHPEQSEGS